MALLRKFLCLAWAISLAAQGVYELARPAMRTYGMEDGLPSTSLFDLAVDGKGRLWAATLQGPAFYTGGGWRAVKPPAAAATHMRAVLATRDGALWFGTQTDALWRLHGGTWTHIPEGPNFPAERVNCLLETFSPAGESVLWVGTASAGVLKLEGGRWTTLGKEAGLADGAVWKLREIREPDGIRRIWAATPSGLCRLQGKNWVRIGPVEGFQGVGVNDILQVAESDGGFSVWVTGWSTGVARWDGREWRYFGAADGFPSRFPTCLAASVGPDRKPVIWVGTYDTGLAWFDGRWHHLDEARGFPSIGVNAVLTLPGGKPMVWLGTRSNGVCTLDPGGWRSLDQRQGLPGAEVSSFLEMPEPGGQSSFWIGTTNGLAHWSNGRLSVEDSRSGMPEKYVQSLARGVDESGQEVIWASSLRGLMKRKDGRWRLYGAAEGFPPGMATSILETRDDRGRSTLWVGLQTGMARLSEGKWRFEMAEGGFPRTAPAALHETHETSGTSFWAGTRGAGLQRFQNGRWRTYGASEGISVQVMGFLNHRSPDGRHWLWIGTAGAGLGRLELDRVDARWTFFTSEQVPGMTSQYLTRMVEDRQGRVYIGSPSGLLRLRFAVDLDGPVPAEVETLTMGDGLPSLACNNSKLFADRNGRIWIGTSRGLAVLDPEHESFAPPPPAPVFDQVASGADMAVAPGQRLSHRDNRLRFEFSLPTFHRTEDTRFQVQVLGLEAEPGPWQKEPFRELLALPSGRYRFQVRARDFGGRLSVWTPFAFEVMPAPWLSPWAFLGYALGTSGLFWLTLSFRTHLLRERSRRLEGEVRERTQALREANTMLQEANAEQRELNEANVRLIGELTQSIAEVKTLQGFIPICANCKKIRDDQGYWEQIEEYIGQRSDATFSHGMCPDCAQHLYPEVYADPEGKFED